jgi:hypothetical protein
VRALQALPRRGGRFKGLTYNFVSVFKGLTYNFVSVLGRFPAKLGPGTPLNKSGSKNGAERTSNQPQRPILIPCRDHFLIDQQN